jgi:hypothetical protein
MFMGHAQVKDLGVGREQPLHERQIAQGGGEEEIGLATSRDEEPRDVRAVLHAILGGRGLVVHISGVDVRAPVEEQRRDFHGAGEVERRLAVASARVHEARVGVEELAKPIDEPEPRGGVRSDDGPSSDQSFGPTIILGRQRDEVEDAETARPPSAFRVDVRAVLEEDVEKIEVALRGDNGGPIEGKMRLVELLAQGREAAEHVAQGFRIAPLDGPDELAQVLSFGSHGGDEEK